MERLSDREATAANRVYGLMYRNFSPARHRYGVQVQVQGTGTGYRVQVQSTGTEYRYRVQVQSTEYRYR